MINAQTDLQLFVDYHRSTSKLLSPHKVIIYENRPTEDYEDEEDTGLCQEDYTHVKEKIQGLLKDGQ